jgi:cytochrome b561
MDALMPRSGNFILAKTVIRYPVLLYGGVRLPAIQPQSDNLHALLWNAHFYLAFLFFAMILMHLAAAFFHALVRQDGVFENFDPLGRSSLPSCDMLELRQPPTNLEKALPRFSFER